MVQYIRKNNYETTHFDDEWIVLNTDNYTLTRLNETGGFCWSLLNEVQTVESLSDVIVRKYGKKCDDINEEIELFLNDLLKCGLVINVV
jgi:hypothetical protein